MGSLFRLIMTYGEGMTTVKIDGQLAGESTRDLLQACAPIPGRLVIDLSDLHFADDEGVKTLSSLKARGADLVGARPYVEMLLEENGQC